MTAADLLAISRYVMPALPLHPAKLGFLFGTRHGVDEFCRETHALWHRHVSTVSPPYEVVKKSPWRRCAALP